MDKMAIEPRRISYNEFSNSLARLFELALANGELIVEKEDGTSISVRPLANGTATKSNEEIAAFLSSAGGWSDVDTDKLIDDIYHSRNISSRPQVSL